MGEQQGVSESGSAGRSPEQQDPAEEAARPAIPVKDRRKLRETGASQGQTEQPGPAPRAVVDPSVELEKAQAEAASHLEDLQRLKAEFDNYRKRVMKEQTALAESASVALVARLLAVVDQFEFAVAAAEESKDFDRMLKGVEMVYGELKEVLRSEGLEPIAAKEQVFDPNFHEAALEIPGDGSGRTVVAEVLRPGYTLKGRVLRPAMVKVTQKAE